MCAPNDVWSLGVILLNLTCGRNPWKQASYQDPTYRAYSRSRDFLKTILPVTDDLNDILARIFNPSPEHRITLPELRERIKACPRLTVPPMAPVVPTPPVTPEHIIDYVMSPEEAIMDDSDCESPLSPASTFSDDGSLTSSGSTIDDLDEDFMSEQQQQTEDVDYGCPSTHMYDPEMSAEAAMYQAQEFIPQKFAPLPVRVMAPMPQQVHIPSNMHCPPQLHVPVPASVPAPVSVSQCQPKAYFPLWEMVKYVQQVPLMQHPVSFHHHQAPVMPAFQGCF
jgi:serine/threonine protein kinase